MARRRTVILADDLAKKLYEIQAKQIKQSKKSVSFSHVMNKLLRKSLKWFWNYFWEVSELLEKGEVSYETEFNIAKQHGQVFLDSTKHWK